MNCIVCKNDYPENQLIRYGRRWRKKTETWAVYYACNPCNTARCKKYRRTPEGAKKIREAVYRSIEKHKHKQEARLILNNHLKMGKIKKPLKCLNCKKDCALEAHHEDYSKPLEVKWLCRPCHCEHHRG